MKYLLDTHVIMWALIDSPKLSKEVKQILFNNDNTIYYSTVSAWEVEIKHLKRENFKLSGKQLCFLCDQNYVLNLPIQNKHVEELENINKDTNHNDPFDKMLLAQAKVENMVLITHDKKFKAYNENNILFV
ncbi:MAG: type II toxin-antitoxin system VapC family toxin [Erysipelotrichaceae bacterium]|nr:type II toxin-antitoxin system VapC family toxin [Erysipelotrichaceae bacterium]